MWWMRAWKRVCGSLNASKKKGTRESGVPIFKGNHLGVIIYRITSVCRIVGENMHENTDGIDCFY